MKEGVSLLQSEFAARDRKTEQDLEVDLVIARVHTGRVVDEVSVDATAGLRVLDPASLCEPEIATFRHYPRPDLFAIHPDQVVGSIAHVCVGFARGLNVRADPPVPQEIDRGLQRPVDQFVGRQVLGRVVGDPQCRSHLR